MAVLGFDVFGTLVDPSGMSDELWPHAGADTERLLAEWRRTQLEFTFRRAAMGRYVPFDRVTRAALDRALTGFGMTMAEQDRERLVATWSRLPAFAESGAALDALRARGHRCLAFSNGTPGGLAALLSHCGLDRHLDAALSVDAVGTYKPAADVYDYLVAEGGARRGETWLISGNDWDVIGARSAGIRAAWIRRSPDSVFDPWEVEPDLVLTDLSGLVAHEAMLRAGAAN